jgi:GT2 family glycosyltransferase
MNHGVALAADELILFTDADVVHCPTSFATGIAILRQRGLDFVSFIPRIDCESFWENVCIPLPLSPFTIQCSTGANDAESANAWAAGAFMLIKADVLQDIGGIAAVKRAIVDDVELARVVKRSGPCRLPSGPESNARAIVQGQSSCVLGSDEECDRADV